MVIAAASGQRHLTLAERYRRLLAAVGAVGAHEVVVWVLTGNGLKDPDAAMRGVPPILEAEASVESVAARSGW